MLTIKYCFPCNMLFRIPYSSSKDLLNFIPLWVNLHPIVVFLPNRRVSQHPQSTIIFSWHTGINGIALPRGGDQDLGSCWAHQLRGSHTESEYSKKKKFNLLTISLLLPVSSLKNKHKNKTTCSITGRKTRNSNHLNRRRWHRRN